MQKTILITIDVEDWFQVENFKPWIPFSTWDSRELRVEKNTHQLLNLFDSIGLKAESSPVEYAQLSFSKNSTGRAKLKAQSRKQRVEGMGHKAKGTTNNAEGFRRRRIDTSQFHQETEKDQNKSQKSSRSCQLKEYKSNPFQNRRDNGPLTTDNGPTKQSPKATFFVLGWLAERLPHLVREIHSRGHEVASHGLSHELCNKMSKEDLKKDLIDSKKLLEDIIGSPIYGYRAPSFSIDNNIIKIIEDAGYLYDSSYNSFTLNRRYGKLNLSSNGSSRIPITISENFYELPISNLELKSPFSFQLPALSSGQNSSNSFVLPFGGGGYFRLLPFPVFKIGVKNILKSNNAYLFYVHPWELDSEQPRVKNASAGYKFRHYINLSKIQGKLAKLIDTFSQCRFITCSQYISELV